MTNLRDYLRDLVIETQNKIIENQDVVNGASIPTKLEEHEIEDLVEDSLKNIIYRLIGD